MSKPSLKSILFLIIVLVGLALSVYLVLNYQTILSRAGSTVYEGFEVKDAQGTTLNQNNGVYETKSLDVNVQIKDLEKLSE